MGKKTGSHSQTIDSVKFFKFINEVGLKNIDVMLEVKDKNISTEKIIGLLNNDKGSIQREWARYKYKVMEKSYSEYKKISALVSKKNVITMKYIKS